MDKAETNGYLRAIEAQLLAVEAVLEEVNRSGDLNDKAYDAFRKVRMDLINAAHAFKEVRGWNAG
jgi:hypothetical protein